MSLLDKLTAHLPFGKSKQVEEYLFAVNIGPQVVSAALWSVAGNKITISPPSSSSYSASEELVEVLDKLLAKALGETNIEVDKVLFGVPEGWLQDEDLKPPYLKLLREIVRTLDLKPLAYVSTTHALSLFLEKDEGAPTTTILAGIEDQFVSVTIVRAGKLDGTKVVKRGDNLGEEIEKALLSFSEVEVLPSKILLYSSDGELDKYKATLLAYPWMGKLSFLHFPKVETLPNYIEVQAVSLAGAVELGGDMKYHISIGDSTGALKKVGQDLSVNEEEKVATDEKLEEEVPPAKESEPTEELSAEALGFVAGDVTKVGEEKMSDLGTTGGDEAEVTADEDQMKNDLKDEAPDKSAEEDSEISGDEEGGQFIDNSKPEPKELGEEETALASETEASLMEPSPKQMEEYNFDGEVPAAPKRQFKIPFLNNFSTKRKAISKSTEDISQIMEAR